MSLLIASAADRFLVFDFLLTILSRCPTFLPGSRVCFLAGKRSFVARSMPLLGPCRAADVHPVCLLPQFFAYDRFIFDCGDLDRVSLLCWAIPWDGLSLS